MAFIYLEDFILPTLGEERFRSEFLWEKNMTHFLREIIFEIQLLKKKGKGGMPAFSSRSSWYQHTGCPVAY
jgi:hypothetical protein